MKIFLGFIIGVVVTFLILALPKIIKFVAPINNLEYEYDALAVILSALSVFLTIFAIIVALLAWFGYTQIKESAEKKAEEVAEEVAEKTAKETAKETADKEIGKSKQEILELEQRKKETEHLIKKDLKATEEFFKPSKGIFKF